MMQYYKSSMIFTILAVIGGYLLGGWPIAWIVLVLGVMETSLSFDNAVVNASVLKNWDETWRRRFLVWGIPIAVFVMRLVFPLAIVGIIAHLNPAAVIDLAINHPDQYSTTLASAHHQISAFGGTFLLMVFLKFFLDESKEIHWIEWLEKPLASLGKIDEAQIGIAVFVVLMVSLFVDPVEQFQFMVSGLAGLLTYIVVDVIGSMLGGEDHDVTTNVVKQGWAGFMYLEVLDASFSFDGVIAAFALSNNIFVIMLGLGVGAFFVRSMTLHLVGKGTLNEYKYLESGAFWAIGALAVIMLSSVYMHIPEMITGFIGVTAICAALWSSIKSNKLEA